MKIRGFIRKRDGLYGFFFNEYNINAGPMGIENLDNVKSIVKAKKEIKDMLKTYYQMQYPEMEVPLMDVNINDKDIYVYIDGNVKLQKL